MYNYMSTCMFRSLLWFYKSKRNTTDIIPGCCECTNFICQLVDSKTLNEEQREELFKTINEHDQILGWITRVLSPNYISNEMLRRWVTNLGGPVSFGSGQCEPLSNCPPPPRLILQIWTVPLLFQAAPNFSHVDAFLFSSSPTSFAF